MSLIILKMKIIFRMIPIIQIAVKRIKSNLTKIGISIGQVLFNCVPKSGQLVNRYCTIIGTTSEQALVPKDKHIQTNQNNKKLNKQEKVKKEFYVFEFLILKIVKKMKASNRYKFYESNVCQTKNGVDQNWDYFVGFV